MAHSGPEPNVTLSLLDRLVDQDLSLRTDPPQGRAQSLRQLKTSLRRDIEWLLNTRRSIEAMGDSSLEIERSLFNYGLPDISSLGVHSAQDQKRLLWMIESTIANFEPRIQGARVTMEPVAGARSAVPDPGPAADRPGAGAGDVRHRTRADQRRVPGEGRLSGCATTFSIITSAS